MISVVVTFSDVDHDVESKSVPPVPREIMDAHAKHDA
eukprot:CAMPEP_0181177232 /NCGR_PEP_ID=MMETSP1096-20121128/5055_1 /TAXON_ID=156174 ORGANISM="Chrysochromulina ericina, Strain CCMP281" /NCGR_SAMPLE_ID=MMETSP1096 /ASSEMBLY_ACC=CAM_ASM_000453 /LENGTH=36 /DNA_ID= /DNA_START= /DNA_END= /DNA_ORIENTATION=